MSHPAVLSGRVELFVLPILTALPDAARILGPSSVGSGAQNLFWEEQGAYTGEVSGSVIAEVGGRYAEVGHAERRSIFGETHEHIGQKLAAAYRNGLTPILCGGEPGRGSHAEAISWCVQELEAALSLAERLGPLGRTIVAYEPRWAIGAGTHAPSTDVSAVIAGIRECLHSRPSQAHSAVIYGGSAGIGLLSELRGAADGLFLGRFAHDPIALKAILDEVVLL